MIQSEYCDDGKEMPKPMEDMKSLSKTDSVHSQRPHQKQCREKVSTIILLNNHLFFTAFRQCRCCMIVLCDDTIVPWAARSRMLTDDAGNFS